MDEAFWQKVKLLVNTSKIVVDRPKGSKHPNYPDFVYPLDYGFLENTKASDGKEVDVWMGSQDIPTTITGIICTIDMTKRDVETKILINCSPEETHLILKLMNTHNMSALLIVPPNSSIM